MDGYLLAVHLAVAVAALFQTATGIGFGIIAGPVLLLAMHSGAAIQVTILLSWLIAALLAPSLYKQADKTLLVRLLAGTLAGVPVGVFIFIQLGINVLEITAGLSVLLMACFVAGWSVFTARRDTNPRGWLWDFGAGVASGAMSASLAMPGPAAVARMASLGRCKDTVRATLLVLFFASYAAAIAFQAAMAGINADTLYLTATLIPATLTGMVLGWKCIAWISEHVLRKLILAVLIATSISLLAHSLSIYFPDG